MDKSEQTEPPTSRFLFPGMMCCAPKDFYVSSSPSGATVRSWPR